MNVIFLTVSRITSIKGRGIYSDLLRHFRDKGHNVYVVSPRERQFNMPTSLVKEDGINILGVRTLNIQKTNFLEKGIGTILLENQFTKAIKKYFKGIPFDLILYSTPPITLVNVIRALKRNNPNAVSYLLLKDIFPQNAVDLGMFSEDGILYKFFRKKEISLYKVSDYIGCMSPANVDFVLKHNAFLDAEKVEVAPNSIELPVSDTDFDRNEIREKYGIPKDKVVFIYGGNLGKPQGIDFLISCLDANKGRGDCHFLVVGNGTEFHKLETWFKEVVPQNASLFAGLPKKEYDLLVKSCDVGLIFLDYRFTIPNYPSRLLSYLENRMPIIAATDINTDIGEIAEQNKYGYKCESNDVAAFSDCVDKFVKHPEVIKDMGENGYQYLLGHYLVKCTYEKIISRVSNV